MRIPTPALLLALWLAASAAAQPEGGVSVPEDLSAVIALQGKPCGRVTGHERLGENDYLVTCESGHRYRVYVSEKGRVVVEER